MGGVAERERRRERRRKGGREREGGEREEGGRGEVYSCSRGLHCQNGRVLTNTYQRNLEAYVARTDEC